LQLRGAVVSFQSVVIVKPRKFTGMHLKQYICVRTKIDHHLNDGIISSNERDALRIRYVSATVDLLLISLTLLSTIIDHCVQWLPVRQSTTENARYQDQKRVHNGIMSMRLMT